MGIKKIDAVRLGEIAVVIRAVQALTSFSTTLIDDLRELVREASNKALITAKEYYSRKLRYYQTELFKNEDKNCSLSELEQLVYLLRTPKSPNIRKNNTVKKSWPTYTQEKYISVSFRTSKKMILLDAFLSVRVSKIEAGSIISMFLNKTTFEPKK